MKIEICEIHCSLTSRSCRDLFSGEIGDPGTWKETTEKAGIVKCGGLGAGIEKYDDEVQVRSECGTKASTRCLNDQ